MEWKDAQKLAKLGFHQGRKGDHWTRHCYGPGLVKAVVLVRGDAKCGYEYRMLVANPLAHKEAEQWFDAEEVPIAVFSLFLANHYWKKARRALEGGLVRRTFRKLIKR